MICLECIDFPGPKENKSDDIQNQTGLTMDKENIIAWSQTKQSQNKFLILSVILCNYG